MYVLSQVNIPGKGNTKVNENDGIFTVNENDGIFTVNENDGITALLITYWFFFCIHYLYG